MQQFIEHLKKRQLSIKTRQDYEKIVVRMGDTDPIEFLKKTITSTTPIGTVLPIRSAVKHYLISEKGLTEDEANEILPKSKGTPSRLRDSLTEEELLLYRQESEKCPEPARTILLLLPETGMRINEICSLRRTDVTEKRRIKGFLFRGKGSKQRFIPLNSRASKLVDQYIHEQHLGGDWLFNGY